MVFAILACLAASPSECKWISPAQDRMSITECITGSQMALAVWAASHPEWVIKQTRCKG